MPTFGDLLRQARKKAGHTLKEVGDHLGYKVVFVSDVERSNRLPLEPRKIVEAAVFLSADPKPMLAAAARERGSFQLDTGVGPKASQVGVALMENWSELSDETIEEIAAALGRKGLLWLRSGDDALREIAADDGV